MAEKSKDGIDEDTSEKLVDQDDLVDYECDLTLEMNKEEFSDLNCDSDEGPEEPVLCYYCDTQLPGPEDVSSHMTGFHNINKHLDFILEVTSRRQKQDLAGAEPISPEPFTSNPTKVEILDDISDIESEEEEGKGKVEIKKKDEIKENVDIKTEEEDEEENKEVEKKKENPSKPIEIDIDNTNKEEESKDDGEEKRDWKYSTEKAVFDILSDQELSDDAENDSRCVKCDLEHVKGKPCHFLLKNGKSTDDKERDKDIRGKKDSNQDKDIRNKLNSNRGRGKGGSGGGRGRGFVRQGIVGDTLRKVKLSGVRKVRVAPPRSDLEKGRAKSVRTLPPSLYNNPDALSSKSRSWRDDDKFEESSYRRSRSPLRSRSPRTFDSSRKSRSQDYRGLRSPSPDRIGWRRNEKRFGDHGRSELDEEPRRDTSQGGWRDDWRIGEERCELCKKENHASEDCPNYFCNKCHTQGHFAKFCTADKNFSASSSFSHPPRALPIQQELWVQPRGSQSYPPNENPSYPGGTSFSGSTNYLGAGAVGSSYLGAGDTNYPGAGGTSYTVTGGTSYTGAGSGAASYPGAGSGGSSYPGSGAGGEPGYPGSQFSQGFNTNNPQSLPGYSGASTGYHGSGYSSYGPGTGYPTPGQESGFPADNRGSGYGQSSFSPLDTASDPSSASYPTSSWRGGSKL